MTILNEVISPLLIKIFINSLNASILVFAIFILRFIFNNKIKIKILYFLWIILIIRLIIPFEFQIFSFVSFDEISRIAIDYSTLYNLDGTTTNHNINISSSSFSYMNILTFIWLSLITVFFIKRLIVIMVFLKSLRDEKEIVDKKIISLFNMCIKKLKLKSSIKIIETNLIKSPCVFGIYKYIILIPTGLLQILGHNEIKCLFFHELSHIKNKDTIIEMITYLLKLIYFFNPFVIFALNQMIKDCEYLSDADSISLAGNDSYTYGNTMIKILENMKSLKLPRHLQGIFSLLAAVNNKKRIKRRLNMIYNNKKRSVFISILSAFILIIVFAFTFTGKIFAETKSKSTEINFINPLDSPKISAKFGEGIDPITMQKRFHYGIDLSEKTGTPVKVSLDGVVVKIEENSENETGYGKYIIVAHNDGYTTLYAKLSKIKVEVGQSLKTSDVIGFVGSTGRATGPHLHFEIRKDSTPLNPENFISF